MMRELEVLVDWRNCTHGIRVQNDIDAELAIQRVDAAVDNLTARLSAVRSVRVTLYGSWSKRSAVLVPTDEAGRVARGCKRASATRGNQRRKFDIATSLAHADLVPDAPAVSAFVAERECRQSGCAKVVREQKLADTMLVVDAAFFGGFPDVGVALMSSDQDMIPGLLTASYFRRAIGGDPSQEIWWILPDGSPETHRRLKRHIAIMGV